MKSLLKNVVVNSVGLYVLPFIFEGAHGNGGVKEYLIAGLVFTLLLYTVKPILQVVTLPINALTFGLFSFVINGIILYLLTVFIATIRVTAFTFQSLNFGGFVIPSIYFNTFFAYIIISLGLFIITEGLRWIFQK